MPAAGGAWGEGEIGSWVRRIKKYTGGWHGGQTAWVCVCFSHAVLAVDEYVGCTNMAVG